MNNTTNALRQWAINKIQTCYPDDIDLLIAVYGHSVNNDGHGECFDYFIPSADRGYKLAKTFIINGIGHDLYPRSWERMEATADCNDPSVFCLADASIVYAKNKEAENRFLKLKERLASNLTNPAFTYKKALERLDMAMDLYRTMMFEDRISQVKMAAGYITQYLSQCICFLNGFLADVSCSNLTEAANLPHSFLTYKEAIIRTQAVSELKHLSHLMISSARDFIRSHYPVIPEKTAEINYTSLASWYEELSLTWRHIDYYCDTNDYQKAYSDACYLQSELNIIREEFQLKEMNLLDAFHYDNLTPLKKRAQDIKRSIIEILINNSILIESYSSIDDFLNAN